MITTPDQVRQEFEIRGLSIAEWARRSGFSVPLVYQVLNGERKALRGQSHKIAVALKLKVGVDGDVDRLPFGIKNEK